MNAALVTAPTSRFDTLDALRGAAMVWMTVFHFCFDLNHFGYLRQNFYQDPFWTWQRTAIVSLFLLCAGMGQAVAIAQQQSWPRFWRRWVQIAGCAVLVSAGSYWMYPNSFIYFGVLHGMAVMLITHAMGVVAETAQRVVVMYAGKVVEEASVEALFARPRHPYTQGLIRSIPRIDTAATHKVRLEAIPGTVPKLIEPAEGCRFAGRCAHVSAECRSATPPLVEVAPGHKVACILETAS